MLRDPNFQTELCAIFSFLMLYIFSSSFLSVIKNNNLYLFYYPISQNTFIGVKLLQSDVWYLASMIWHHLISSKG